MSIDTAEERYVAHVRSEDTKGDIGPEADRDSRQWTIKGLAPETVEVTREAAKRSGMKLNSFVSLALERAAANVAGGSIMTTAESNPDDLHAIKEELAKIRAQGEQLESTINSISSILLKMMADRIRE